MARSIWTGSINFGLVTVPVELYSATEDSRVGFRQFERGTSDRIRNRRVNERTGDEVGFDDIVKGYELEDGDYVLIEPDELEDVAPGRSRTLDIETFVDLDQVDPIYFQKTYWLAPAKEEFNRAYSLLLEAMSRSHKAGIATFVMRGKEHIAAVRAGDSVLSLTVLHFADDIRDPRRALKKLPAKSAAKPKEVDMAVDLIDSMTTEWVPDQYHDSYTERVEKLIADKRAGRTVSREDEPASATAVVDLFDALSRSVKGRSKKKAVDLSELSKAELEKMARDLDVKGRSKMTRAELEKAVSSPRKKAS
jgi:DNA end-binding protein Ku